MCVKLLAFRDTVNVCSVPSVPLLTDNVLLRGIVVNTFDALAVIVPLETPDVNDAEHDNVFLPSELCDIFSVFVNIVWLPLVLSFSLKVLVNVYFVPSIITYPLFSVLLKLPYVQLITAFTVTFDVLLSIL